MNADEITGMCPVCNVEMVVVEGGERRSESYDTCESCGGIWVDGDEDEPPAELDAARAEETIVAFFRKFLKKR